MEPRILETIDELLRLLAAAAGAARLYPATSELPRQAIARFLAAARASTAGGPVRFVVDPGAIRFGDEVLGGGHPQVVALAEALHSLQVGQLVIAPGVTETEAIAFLGVAASEPRDITERGGIRAALVAAGVGHIAVIEVSLRPSTEQGILGLDLTLAPLAEIGPAAVSCAEEWRASAATGEGTDDMSTAIERLEPATRELAAHRVAQALMHLPEDKRREVIASALFPDSRGSRMEGMLSVVAQMKPAALARLLTLTAGEMGLRGLDLARTLDLPPEVARELQLLLTPSPQSEESRGVPADPEVDSTADAMRGFEEDAEPAIAAALATATPAIAAGKALDTTLAVLSASPKPEAVAAIGDALPQALRHGAVEAVADALRRLEALAGDPALGAHVSVARRVIGDPSILAAACRAVHPSTDPTELAAVLTAGASAGAEAVLTCYADAPEAVRPVLQRAATLTAESVIPAAGRLLRVAETPVAIAAIRLLATLGDKRAIPVLGQALEHVDVTVRRAAVTALADFGGEDAAGLLGRALAHWDPETRRFVAHEIGRARVVGALPALTRIMDGIYLFDRNHELKKEVLKSLESLDSPAALPALERIASRRFLAGRKNRELQFLARKALERLRPVGKPERGDAL